MAKTTLCSFTEALGENHLLYSNRTWRSPLISFLLPQRVLANRNGTLTVNEILCPRKLNTDIPPVERRRKKKKNTIVTVARFDFKILTEEMAYQIKTLRTGSDSILQPLLGIARGSLTGTEQNLALYACFWFLFLQYATRSTPWAHCSLIRGYKVVPGLKAL